MEFRWKKYQRRLSLSHHRCRSHKGLIQQKNWVKHIMYALCKRPYLYVTEKNIRYPQSFNECTPKTAITILGRGSNILMNFYKF